MKERKEVEIHARVTPSLKKRLKARAEERGVKPSVLVREAIQKFFENPVTREDLEKFREENIRFLARGLMVGTLWKPVLEQPVLEFKDWDELLGVIAKHHGRTKGEILAMMKKWEDMYVEQWKKGSK